MGIKLFRRFILIHSLARRCMGGRGGKKGGERKCGGKREEIGEEEQNGAQEFERKVDV